MPITNPHNTHGFSKYILPPSDIGNTIRIYNKNKQLNIE
jgi:hypothetical protein